METLRPFYLFHSQNNSTESRGTGLEGDPNRALQGPLISVTGEREGAQLRFRAATAQVQRRKWTLVRSLVV
jgi:hypothetical protein